MLRASPSFNNHLLVLDDVWNVEKWEELNSDLIGVNRNKGNRIVVTSRSQDVASKVQTLPNGRHQPGTLEVDECWSIIKERAFRGIRMSQELELIGKGIAEKCQGVPLIAKVIGGIMYNIGMNPDAWLKIQKSDVWDSVESVLKLSFDHLSSPSLKKCFAYCAMFPKDFCFEKEQLIQIWMAEGFLQAPRDSSVTMMDIGNKYFNEFVSNSLFQDVEMDKCGNILTCKMHDMMHDLALSVSKFDTSIFEENSTSIAEKVPHIRHLNISYDGESLPRILTEGAPRLHSLFSKVDVFKDMSLTFKSLRVLKFCGADYILELPDSLGKLKHLKYLDISKTSILTLPRPITKLYKLQTLRFMGCGLLTLPDGLRNLISLRHIHFDHESLQPIELRHLTSLQTLPMFVVGDLLERRIDALKCLNQLGGKLYIRKLECVRDKDEAMGADLCKKLRLGKLIFEWSSRRGSYGNDEVVLENLQPHPNLQSLIIRGYEGEKFPSWMLRPVHGSSNGLFLLNNVMELELINCINCKSLPSLGQLQNLKFLTLEKLKEVKCMGNEFYYDASSDGKNEVITVFSALKRFTLLEMPNLEEWTAMAATVVMFPCLEELDISECPLLKSIPLTGQCLSLKKLLIYNCENLRKIGDGLSTFTCLKDLYLEICPNLSSIPDLEGFSSLRKLCVSKCYNLEIVPLSGRCSSLENLHISWCEKVIKIGDGLCTSTCLQELSLELCPNLSSIPDLEGFSSLRSLDVSECYKLESVPLRGRCSSLEKLHICSCEKLNKIGDGLSASSTCLKELWLRQCPNLSSIPDLEGFSSLRSLYVSSCDKLESVPLRGRCSSLEKLHISYCENLSKIGDGLSAATGLKDLYLEKCRNLRSIPDLEGFSSLRAIHVSFCSELEIVPLSGRCSSLEKLRIYRCKKLSNIGDGLSTSSTCLQVLSIWRCPNLSSIPDLEGFSSLRSLHVSFCGKLESVPLRGRCSSLEKLDIRSCEKLSKIGDGLSTSTCLQKLSLISCSNLSSIPDLEGFSSLRSLDVLLCGKLESVPLRGRCSSLENLHIFRCKKLSKIGDGLSTSTCLQELRLLECPNLSFIPDLEGFSSLRSLDVSLCGKLKIVPLRGGCSSLERLHIFSCQNLRKIEDGLSISTCLKYLSLDDCPNLSSIPVLEGFSSLQNLCVSRCYQLDIVPITRRCSAATGLKDLSLIHCPNLNSFPNLEGLSSLQSLQVVDCCKLRSVSDDSLGSLTTLRELKIGGFSEELEGFHSLNSIQHLGASLRSLDLIGWEKLKSLTHQLQHLTALQELRIERFQGIEALPEWLGNLSSLKQLKIISCDNLTYLPSLDVILSLYKLEEFEISGCPQLQSRCAKETGPEWSKISHIPLICINKELIQNNAPLISNLYLFPKILPSSES